MKKGIWWPNLKMDGVPTETQASGVNIAEGIVHNILPALSQWRWKGKNKNKSKIEERFGGLNSFCNKYVIKMFHVW